MIPYDNYIVTAFKRADSSLANGAARDEIP
jgi:hypothetical protein